MHMPYFHIDKNNHVSHVEIIPGIEQLADDKERETSRQTLLNFGKRIIPEYVGMSCNTFIERLEQEAYRMTQTKEAQGVRWGIFPKGIDAARSVFFELIAGDGAIHAINSNGKLYKLELPAIQSFVSAYGGH